MIHSKRHVEANQSNHVRKLNNQKGIHHTPVLIFFSQRQWLKLGLGMLETMPEERTATLAAPCPIAMGRIVSRIED